MKDTDKLQGISEENFKQGMRQFASAVNVITVKYGDIQDGLTATAVCSVSALPPHLLICVHQEASAHEQLLKSGKFGLNVLSTKQESIAKRFAGIDNSKREERYDIGHWTQLTTDSPILVDALVGFDCEIINSVTAGTHSIIIGHIVDVCYGEGTPLVYKDGKFIELK